MFVWSAVTFESINLLQFYLYLFNNLKKWFIFVAAIYDLYNWYHNFYLPYLMDVYGVLIK
jgi:hypothetical protein